ncbi:MAG: hypothetical protein IIA70_08575, partial [Proteobacteria bacterium]|nr:hypothetical protein [Pseudomonadota bacterium]
MARWVRFVRRNQKPVLTPYLQGVVADRQSQIVLALDMEEMLEPQAIVARLDASESLQGKPKARQALAELLRGLRGVRMHVQIEVKTTAAIWIDFSTNVGEEGKALKPLLLELMNDNGASLEDFETADVRIEGKSVAIVTQLSDEGLRRVMTLILAPHPAVRTDVAKGPRAEPTGIDESFRYYRAVNRIVDDLKRANRRAKNYQRTVTWHENFAKKIGRLPITGVDPALVDYGANVGSKLRALAATAVPDQRNLKTNLARARRIHTFS